jgi:hypothetical protein
LLFLNFPTPEEVAAADPKSKDWRQSRFVGVSWNAAAGKWAARITYNGKRHELGFFPQHTEEDAARAFDMVARLHGVGNAFGFKTTYRLNFPTEEEVDLTVAKLEGMWRPRKSQFHGVTWDKRGGKWAVHVTLRGKGHFINTFPADQEKAAARAFDEAARRIRGARAHGGGKGKRYRLNFPTAAEAATLREILASS